MKDDVEEVLRLLKIALICIFLILVIWLLK